MIQIDIISLFPEMFTALEHGIVGRAIRNQLLQIKHWNPRDFATDPHRTVDDRPYGGGPGMVMLFEPLFQAIQAAKANNLNGVGVVEDKSSTKVIQLTPQGKPLSQNAVQTLAKQSQLILVAGRYEGIDERLTETIIDEQWSIGDYVLSGGELPAMVMIDAIARLLPGALGDETSAVQDSFSNGLLDHPHYTRPDQISGKSVPKVLLSGNHQAISRWRLKQSLGKTWQKRSDLIKRRVLSQEEQLLLNEFIQEHAEGKTHE